MSNHPSTFDTIRARTARKGKPKWLLISGCLLVVGIMGILLVIAGLVYFRPVDQSQSVIIFKEPVENATYYLGDTITLRTVAKDDDNVKQVEIWAGDQLIQLDNSEVQSGVSPFPVITTWYPIQAGMYTISARSTNALGKQSVNFITVNIKEIMDQDGDQIPDDMDNCPQQAGNDSGVGCMDTDFDGIPDETDVCPLEAGLPDDGCPSPSEEDRDGDGMLDIADACPDEVGSPGALGCPDRDGDGYADNEDACPDEAGTFSDCPTPGDADGDSVPDSEDTCPLEPGSADLAGCSDDDADGVLDFEDECPGTTGSATDLGCPQMAADGPMFPPVPEDDDNPPEEGDDGLGDPFSGYKTILPVEIEGYSLFVRGRYDRVACYLHVNGYSPLLYEINRIDSHYWDIAAEMAGENSLYLPNVDDEYPLDLQLECLGYNDDDFDVISDISVSHPVEEWDGRDLQAEYNDGGFVINYHICAYSCEAVPLPAPYLEPIVIGPESEGPYEARWQWDGDEGAIDGFVIIDVQRYDTPTLYIIHSPETRRVSMNDFVPACGETLNLAIYAFRETEDGLIMSRRSNIEEWAASGCNHQALITFNYLDVHDIPGDERGYSTVGPIYGYFLADTTAAESQMLGFRAHWFNIHGTRQGGLRLSGRRYPIQSIFDWIIREMDSCLGNGCNSNRYATAETNTILVEFDEGDVISVGGRVMDHDLRNADDVFFEGFVPINLDGVEPGTYPMVIEDRYADLHLDVTLLPDE
ncbi:MAG: thrombospondin type 3 repeat-containing protein [Anaerolineaceae bacterium]|nr:thrombospondin type 3 repeat-containing protein [Anaerolineaceae bacterium]